MALNQQRSGKAISMPAGLALGCLVSLVLTAGGIWLLSSLVSGEMLRWENVGYGVMAVLFVVPMMGTTVARIRIKRQHFFVSQLMAALYYILLLAITALLFGGQYEALGVTAVLVWGGSTATIFLFPTNKKGMQYKKKYRHDR